MYQANAGVLLLATATSHPNNLPVQHTSFIGREAQVAQVKELVRQHILVTLTGINGSLVERIKERQAQAPASHLTFGVSRRSV